MVLHRDDGRRAVHHDDAGAYEQERGGEEPFVRFEFSRHTPPPKGPLESDRKLPRDRASLCAVQAPVRRTARQGRTGPAFATPRMRTGLSVSSQQSSAGWGLRHHPRRPGQPAFPADGSSPHHPG
jgi:hypothetical protein